MRPLPRMLLGALILAVGLALVVTLLVRPTGKSTSDAGLEGPHLPSGLSPRPFTLPDQQGMQVSLASQTGKVRILAFLNTACGDTCFLTAQQLRGTLDELGHGVPTLVISTDPASDTPQQVRRFLTSASLSGRVEYLVGSRSQDDAIAKSYGLLLPVRDSTPSTLTYVVVIDRQGRPRVGFSIEELAPEALTNDVRKLEGG